MARGRVGCQKPHAQGQPYPYQNQKEAKKDTSSNYGRSLWEEKYLASKAKSKVKELELKEQNKALQDKFQQAQEDKFNMMMTMFYKLNENKEAQEKRYEGQKEALESKFADAQQLNINLLMKMVTEQKTQNDETKSMFREMLGMKDDKIRAIEETNRYNEGRVLQLEEEVGVMGVGGGDMSSDFVEG